MKKSFILIFIFVLFIILPFKVSATTVNSDSEFVNALGGNEYATIIDGVIILQKDINLVENITLESGTYTLDLNGKNIQDNENVKTHIIRLNNSALTINDSQGNGSIKSKVGNRTLWVASGGNLKINNGEIFGYNSIICYKNSITEINNGHFEGESSAFVIYGGNVKINNGTFTTKDNETVYLASGIETDEALTINDGNFEGQIPFHHNIGNFIINGGNFSGEKYSIYLNLNEIAKSKINEGFFNKGIALYQVNLIHEPVITVEKGLINDLIPTLIGETSTIKPNGYINKLEDIELIREEEIFKTEDNIRIEILNINLDANGGKFLDGTDKTKLIYTNSSHIPTPSREGYKFNGFYTKDGKLFLDVINSETGVEKDTTFYALWETEIENPNTFDGIESCIFTATISLIGLISTIICFRKNIKA